MSGYQLRVMVISKLIIYCWLFDKIKRKYQHHSLLLFSENMQNTKINAIVTKSAFLIFGNISKMLRLYSRRFHCCNIRDISNNMTFSSVDPAWNAFYSYRLWQMAFSASTLSGTSKRISDSSVKLSFEDKCERTAWYWLINEKFKRNCDWLCYCLSDVHFLLNR